MTTQHKLIFNCSAAIFLVLIQTGYAADPHHVPISKNSIHSANKNYPIEHYTSSFQSQFSKWFNNNYGNELQNIKKQTTASQANDIRQSIVDKFTNMTKDLVYDPQHPEKFFEHFIAGCTFVIALEKQFIPYGEKLLGDRSRLVIIAKEKYSEQVQYLNSLKQQTNVLEQSKSKK